MSYLDNPERLRETEPPNRTSANNDGFGAPSTSAAFVTAMHCSMSAIRKAGLPLILVP
jgi:hypothetical protein